MFVCCVVQVIMQHHDSTSTDLVLVFPCLYELYRDGVAITRMTVLQRGIGSMERAEVRDQPELHLTITESLYKVFVRLPGRVSQFLHQYRQYQKKASSQYSQYANEEGVFSRYPLFHSHFHSRLLTMSEKSEISSEELPAAAARPVKRKLSVLDPAVRLPPNHEEASVSSVSCLNMTFLVNEAR